MILITSLVPRRFELLLIWIILIVVLNRYHSTDTDTDISKMAKNGRLSADTDIYLIKYHSTDTDTDISKMADIGRYRYRYRFNTTG